MWIPLRFTRDHVAARSPQVTAAQLKLVDRWKLAPCLLYLFCKWFSAFQTPTGSQDIHSTASQPLHSNEENEDGHSSTTAALILLDSVLKETSKSLTGCHSEADPSIIYIWSGGTPSLTKEINVLLRNVYLCENDSPAWIDWFNN